jgi:two-component system response regulator NreC
MNSDPALFSKILSDKEQQILRLIAEGNSNEEIAEIEGSKVTTILFHRKNIMNKLNIHSAPELMRYAFQKGFAKF